MKQNEGPRYEFQCTCINCKKGPELRTTELWVELKRGMLCEKCWKEIVSNMNGKFQGK